MAMEKYGLSDHPPKNQCPGVAGRGLRGAQHPDLCRAGLWRRHPIRAISAASGTAWSQGLLPRTHEAHSPASLAERPDRVHQLDGASEILRFSLRAHESAAAARYRSRVDTKSNPLS